MSRGHNENAVRLGILADDAQRALDRVAQGEADAIDGWLAYGAALNEGRSLFPGDREFGEWLRSSNLDKREGCDVHPGEQQAAMWAAANADQFAEARAASNARTVRGIHAKWKEIEAERERERLAEERRQKAEAERAEAEAKAAAARETAEKRAAAEAEARKAAQEAKGEAARAEAESRATEAAAAREAAERQVEEAETAAAEPEPEPDPDAEARAALAGLTREGLEDEVIGLRAENADLRAKLKAAAADVKALKAKLADHADGDKDKVIRRLQQEARHAQSERFRAEEKFASEKKKTYALKKRVEELERIEIPLN